MSRRHAHHIVTRWQILLAVPLLLGIMTASLRGQVIQDSVASLQGIDVIEHLGEKIPLDLTFTNDKGERVQLSKYFNQEKPVVLVLAYYSCPMLCTIVLNGLVNGLNKVDWTPGEEFTVLTISIDPTETAQLAAAKKSRYLDSYDKPGAQQGWDFFVGEESQSKALADAVGFQYYYDEPNEQYAHPAVVFILTEEGNISRYLYGIEYKPNDLRLGLLEASEGKVGSTLDKLILYCYHFDPDAGSYTLFAANVMRLGGLATLILLTLAIGALWFRERRRKASGSSFSD